MLFRPQRPQRVLGLVTWQGLIPRRQPELAAKAAEIIERELVSNHVIHDKIRGVDIKPGLRTAVSRLIRQRLVPKLQGIPLVGNFVNDQAVESLENMALEEIDKEGEVLMEKIATKFESNFDVKHIVEQRIQEFDLDRLESIVMEVARKEFKTIERLGFVLCFVVGCLQVALIWFTGGMG